MDPPPFTAASAATIPPPATVCYTDSTNSSPRSFDEPPPRDGGSTGGKLRLMISYGGHIIPRPHDKTLCYVGGETRIFATNRNTSLAELSNRLSKTFLNGKPFCLKYQLQNEDLDSLISVTSDEDLENMIDEYDRIMNSSSSKISRLRLFLFPSKIDNNNNNDSSTIGLIRDGSTISEDWFVNVLNGANSNASTKVFSESSSVNCLLGLDDNVEEKLEVKKNTQDVQSVPDSPMVETTSSFGSGSSMPNLPRIRVQVEENNQKGSVGGFVGLSSPPAPVVVAPVSVASGVPVVEQQQQPQQVQPNSPNSVSSEGSGRQRHYFYQEPVVHFQSGSGRISGNSVDPNTSDSISRAQVKQVQDGGGYALPVQYDQHPQMLQPQQYVHAGQQYIQHTPSGPVPMASYYPIYPSQHQTHMQHQNLEHQYPVYFIPARPGQSYGLPLHQTSYSEPSQTVPPTRPQTPPTMVNPVAAAPQLVQIPGSHQINPGPHQPQYVNYSQMHHPSQSLPPTSAATTNYAYDFADPTHTKMYYSQPLAPQLAAQYQTMTSPPAVSFTETSAQHPVENSKQHIRTSQA
ncbi:protein PAL OF QUIRKY-like [Lycium ferocissimum]|uniref:protein PAL OF QUIRKY-like n=1 Tax=Lycium ferocissimum TaxID=112874 RepID=UPI0028159CBD|nr:protein PAL OF QUIRKY-like [Lycium ferocissimum]